MSRKSIIILLFLFISSPLYSSKPPEKISEDIRMRIEKDFKKLINYRYLSKADSLEFARQRYSQLSIREIERIPDAFTIPIELIAFRNAGEGSYVIKYSTERSLGIGYIPSDLMAQYELEAWKAYKIFEYDVPNLSIVLAQQFTESHFDPKIIGDFGQSIGLPQLYKKTAQWLYDQDSVFWKDFFVFEEGGMHKFKGINEMIRFPFYFLPKCKKFRMDQKLEGLRRYNGAGDQAVAYAQLVMRRSLFYEEWMNEFREVKITESQFQKLIYDMVNMQLFNKGKEWISEYEMKDMFQLAKLEFVQSDPSLNQGINLSLETYFEREIKVKQNRNYTPEDNSKEHFIRIEEGRTLYSYFKKVKNLVEVVNHPKNAQYFCYYKQKGELVKIKHYTEVKGHDFYTNAKVGDWIYIPPDVILYSPKTDVLILAKNL